MNPDALIAEARKRLHTRLNRIVAQKARRLREASERRPVAPPPKEAK